MAAGVESSKLQILLVEDSLDDADLIILALRQGGLAFDHIVCFTEPDLQAALHRQFWDLVLTDYNLPALSAHDVVAMVRADPRDIPVIVVSGHIGEDEAVSLMKSGASDFISKNNLARLLPAVEREIREAEVRRSERLALDELQASRRQLRELSAFLQRVREEERAHIARELHDELGQLLSGLHMDVGWLQRRLPADDGPEASKIAAMTSLIDSALRTVRRISTDLRPAVLDDLGLEAAIEWLVENFQTRVGIACDLRVDMNGPVLDDTVAIAVFRLVQESLTNIGRHAQATQVVVELTQERQALRLRIEDDGVGFDVGIGRPQSFGLLGMRERALALDGHFEIDSRPGAGTVITVNIPQLAVGSC